MKKFISPLLKIGLCTVGCLYTISEITYAQVIPDGTVNTQVNQTGNISEIIGGETRNSNLFHSFQEFSISTGNEAFFNNAATIENIFSRVTGGNISNIDGLIRANSANLFLLNPAGIIFGPDARLNIGGSFIGTTADSILFSDGIEFSATNTQPQPTLTINAPIGLNLRDNPGEIVNRSFDEENLTGLEVPTEETLALIGGNVLIEGGFLTTEGGRIELGSVAENSTVSITPVEKGFDFGYEEVANFQDISLSSDALVKTSGANTGDIEVQGRNISLIQGSSIGIETSEGQAGNVSFIASESLTLEGNGLDDSNLTEIFSNVFGDATGEESIIGINTPKLTMTDFANLGGFNDGGTGQGVSININASEIVAETDSLIFAQVFEFATGNGGNITIKTDKLTLNEGAQIATNTFGSGNGGNIVVNASESIELKGTNPDNDNPSGISTGVEIPLFSIPTAGNSGDITINTSTLMVSDGAQIQTVARNNGNGGSLTINTSDSILLTETSPSAELQGLGRSAILVSTEPSFEEVESTNFETGEQIFTGEIIPTTGNGGNLILNTDKLIIEQGAVISADTFSLGNGGNANINVNELILRDGGQITAGSLIEPNFIDTARGNGGNLNITATESVEITGIGDINGEPVNSSLFTLAESNGNAGNTFLTTNNLTVSDGGDINASATSTGAAGNVTIDANSVDLDQGKLTASTAAGTGGNITLDINDNITLRDESLISAQATGTANGGNVTIVDSEFIIAYPSQPNGSDILATAVEGTGGNINIIAESVLGIEPRPAETGNGTNDIDASSQFGIDGDVLISNPDTNIRQIDTEVPKNIVEPETLGINACSGGGETEASSFTIKGKGGIPLQPTERFTADALIPDGKPITIDKETDLNSLLEEELETEQRDANYDPNYIPPYIKPIKTSMGDIYPARGIIKTEDGEIILTVYPTDNIDTRTPHNSANCTPL